jgi:hypothetical protein
VLAPCSRGAASAALALAFCLGARAQGQAAPDAKDSPGPKVEEQTLGPSKQGNTYVVSSKGCHLATVAQKGSRFIVVVDGVEGPKFDEISAIDSGKVVLSADGQRYAYVGRSGSDFVLVVDGKEAMRPGTSTLAYSQAPVQHLEFTSNGKHYSFVQSVHKPGPPEENYNSVVFDGTPEIGGGTQPTFSPDGEHYAYVATNPKPPNQTMIVRDGKPAGYAGTDPLFTGDSQHLLVKTSIALGQNRGMGLEMLLDGKPFLRAENAQIFAAPAGNLVVSAVHRSGANGSAPQTFLVIGGKKIEGSDCSSVMAVAFSPDGNRYAATCQTTSNTQFLFVDGKRGQEYAMIQNVAFSPDSNRCAYAGMMNGKSFVVLDGEESDGVTGAPDVVFGGGGKRVGYLAMGDGNQRTSVVDGAAKKWNQASCSAFGFCGDGSHYAFLLGGGAVQHIVVDGVENPTIQVMSFGSSGGQLPPWYVFSADGKHLAVYGSLASKPDQSTLGLYVDGKRVVAGANFSSVTFSADGKHLAWSAFDPDGQHRAVWYDGKRCAQFDTNGPIGVDAHTWEMGADGVLTTLGPDGDRIKRVRVTPSADASLETLLAGPAK